MGFKMIPRSPAERFLVYLTTLPERLNTAQVMARAEGLGLEVVSGAYIDSLRSKYPVPVPFRPTSKRHKPSREYLLRCGIRELYFATDAVRGALDLLDKPRARELAEALIIARLPVQSIAQTVKRCTGYSAPAEVYDLYKSLFFDVNLFDTRTLRRLLEEQAARDLDLDDKTRAEELRRTASQDPRRIAAMIPDPKLAAVAAVRAAGRFSQAVDFRQHLEWVRDLSAAQAVASISDGQLAGARKAESYMRASRIAAEMLTETATPAEELMKHLTNIKLVANKVKIVTLADLPGEVGNAQPTHLPTTSGLDPSVSLEEEDEDAT